MASVVRDFGVVSSKAKSPQDSGRQIITPLLFSGCSSIPFHISSSSSVGSSDCNERSSWSEGVEYSETVVRNTIRTEDARKYNEKEHRKLRETRKGLDDLELQGFNINALDVHAGCRSLR
jgi:hypothetical protein